MSFQYQEKQLPEIRICVASLPRIFWSSVELVGNAASICLHSSCNSFIALLSMLGIGGTSPSDQVGNVLAAAMTAPSTKLSPPLDRRSATKFYRYFKLWRCLV